MFISAELLYTGQIGLLSGHGPLLVKCTTKHNGAMSTAAWSRLL